MLSPALLTNDPLPVVVTAESTYALFAASLACTGAGNCGEAVNCFAPEIVSVPLRCTTELSSAFPANAVSTYCLLTGAAALPPEPKIVRTLAMVVGELVGQPVFSFHRAIIELIHNRVDHVG